MTETAAPMELLTSSRMRSYRECARLHSFKYERRWRPVRTSEALRFGSLVHEGLEAYWRGVAAIQTGAADTAPRDLAMTAVFKSVAVDEFEKARAAQMIRWYCARWRNDVETYEVLGVETKFVCALVNPATMFPSQTFKLAGRIDVVVRRRSDGRVLVVEHKTTSEDISNDGTDYWTLLFMDPQISCYVVGAESLGYKVDEILYDVLKKPTQKPLKATPAESRKRRADGEYYAGTRLNDETPVEFGRRVDEAISEDVERFIQRKPIPRTESQVADFLADAWAQAGAIRDGRRLGRAPRNPDACLRFGRCPFFSLCPVNADPADYPAEFVQVDDVNPELLEAV